MKNIDTTIISKSPETVSFDANGTSNECEIKIKLKLYPMATDSLNGEALLELDPLMNSFRFIYRSKLFKEYIGLIRNDDEYTIKFKLKKEDGFAGSPPINMVVKVLNVDEGGFGYNDTIINWDYQS